MKGGTSARDGCSRLPIREVCESLAIRGVSPSELRIAGQNLFERLHDLGVKLFVTPLNEPTIDVLVRDSVFEKDLVCFRAEDLRSIPAEFYRANMVFRERTRNSRGILGLKNLSCPLVHTREFSRFLPLLKHDTQSIQRIQHVKGISLRLRQQRVEVNHVPVVMSVRADERNNVVLDLYEFVGPEPYGFEELDANQSAEILGPNRTVFGFLFRLLPEKTCP